MAHDMELVEQNRGVRRMRRRRQTERPLHIHHRKANAPALFCAEPDIELAHARLRAVLAAKPDRPAAQEIAHHDPISVALADRNLVNADHLRTRPARSRKLGLHVLLVERLDRVPVKPQIRRNVLDRRRSTAPADVIGKALGVVRIVRQKVEPLALHLAAVATVKPAHLQFQENPRVAARQIAHPANLAIVPAHLHATATAACRFFDRRLSPITRAFGSPKMPRTVGSGRKPGKQYASQSRRLRFAVPAIHPAWQNRPAS